MHLYLIGYRGSGKTTLAALLATELQRPWKDTDRVVEGLAGETIRQIFEREGEAAFRDLECEAIRLVASEPPQVIALGGGAILREENRKCIRASGKAVWLQASPEALAQRISADAATSSQRPALTNLGVIDEIRTVLANRQPLYDAVADFRVETDRNSLPELAHTICQWFDDFK